MATYVVHESAPNRNAMTAWATGQSPNVGDRRKHTSAKYWFYLKTKGSGNTVGTVPTGTYNQEFTDANGNVWKIKGTGDGYGTAVDAYNFVGDRAFNIYDTLSATNINALAVRDVIKVHAATYSLTAALTAPSLATTMADALTIAPADSNGNLDFTQMITLDGNSIGSGAVISFSNAWIAYNLKAYRGPGDGFATSSKTWLINCEANALTGNGYTNACVGKLEYCRAISCATFGFPMSDGVPLYKCVGKDNSIANFICLGAGATLVMYGCESIVSGTLTGDFTHASSTEGAIYADCTFRTVNAQNNAYYNKAISSVTTNHQAVVLNNIFDNFQNAGSGLAQIDNAAGVSNPQWHVGGNNAYNLKQGGYSTTPKITISALDTTNPAFVSSTNHTPTADLTAVAVLKPVDGVSTGDKTVGAVANAATAAGLKQVFGGVR